jgi:hypothetical protein
VSGAAPRSPGLGRIAALGVVIACGHGGRTAPPGPAREGLSIALYVARDGSSLAMIDDRRWREVAGDVLVLDHLAPAAALAALVIEPLAGGALDVGTCLRARLSAVLEPGLADGATAAGALEDVIADPDPGEAISPGEDAAEDAAEDAEPGPAGDGAAATEALARVAPELRCAVHAAPGRYLVRVLYASPGLGYRAQHDLAMTAPDRATVVSRFAIATPGWHARAEVTLFDGLPGGELPAREVARETIALDGGTAVISAPPRDVAARLRWVYRGVAHGSDADDGDAPHAAQSAVWVWLELDDAALAPGPVRAHVEVAGEPPRDLDVPEADRRQAATALRLPLWSDEQLRGKRDHRLGLPAGASLIDHVAVSIANTGAATRDVWIEELLPPARLRPVVHAWPSEPILFENRLRLKLTVPGGKLERVRFEIAYDR